MRQVVNLETGEITLEDDAPVTVPTPEEIQAQINAEALAYLAENDWVLRKIYQADIEGLDIAPLKLKYADILAGLNSARLAIK